MNILKCNRSTIQLCLSKHKYLKLMKATRPIRFLCIEILKKKIFFLEKN